MSRGEFQLRMGLTQTLGGTGHAIEAMTHTTIVSIGLETT